MLPLLLVVNTAVYADALQVTATLVETDPVSPAALHGNDNVYVHFHYVASAPASIWVAPYSHGQKVSAITSGSPPYPAGVGEGFAFFACNQACSVDSIHFQSAPQGSGYPSADQSVPVDFSWDGAPGQWHTPAAWVKPFQDQEAAREKAAYNAYMSAPLGASGVLSLIVFGLMLLGALLVLVIWPVYGLIRWQGKWRWLAAAPLALTLLKTFSIGSDLARDPSTHNLLPFEYLVIGVIAAPYMILVWLFRRKALKAEVQ
jgi:hypothetical protein